jgi:predicted MPP superfamily phosphohydrolase
MPSVPTIAEAAEHDESPTRLSRPAPAPSGDLHSGIKVRRYAGSVAYLEQISKLRVAHLTDIHVGRVTPTRVQMDAVELTNRYKPDLIVMTGDFVCHSQDYLGELEEVVKRLQAPVIGVLGNHDYWSGADEVIRALQRGGMEVLRNANTVITLNHQRLQIVGLDDAYTGHADKEKALKGLRRDLPTLGLSHIAEEADVLWQHGVPLVLSGHTHAGQITVAKLHELAIGKLAGHKYVHGLYGNRGRKQGPLGAVYVGAGIGSAVLPLRFGERARREIALFDLGAPPGSIDEHHEEQSPGQGRKPSAKTIAKRAAQVAKNHAKRSGKPK